MAITERLIRVEIIEHRAARMLLGISDDLAGLYVQGRTEAEIDARMPRAIHDLLAAAGRPAADVRLVDGAIDGAPADAAPPSRTRLFAIAA